MTRTMLSFPVQKVAPLSCIWIETGDPRLPLACKWVSHPTSSEAPMTTEVDEPEDCLLCA